MPDLILSNEGEQYLLDACVRLPWLASEDWELHLFKNNFTPDKDWTVGDLVEADFPGYASHTLTRATWVPAITSGGRAVTFYDVLPQEFPTSSSPQTVYGYWIDVPSLGVSVLVQRFDTPQLVTTGAPALVLPVLALHSEYEP